MMSPAAVAELPTDRSSVERPGAAVARATAVLIGRPPTAAQEAEVAAGLAPRFEFIELARRLDAEVVSLGHWGGPLRAVARRAPLMAASLAAGLEAGRWQAIYTTGEDLGLRLATLMKVRRWRGRLVCVVHACLSERRKAYLRALGTGAFHAMVCVSEAQRDVLVNECRLPAEKVHAVFNWVDTKFFQPRPPGDRASVFACGLENRDYETLIAAAARLPHVRFKIAASGFNGKGAVAAEPSSNVTILRHRIPYAELRSAYAEAGLVVVPLHPVPYAAGVTGLLEAMAMGRPVVATRSAGIREYLSEPPGLTVPPREPAALAEAIRTVMEQPRLCEAIGARNRAWCERNATIEGYVERIAQLIG